MLSVQDRLEQPLTTGKPSLENAGFVGVGGLFFVDTGRLSFTLGGFIIRWFHDNSFKDFVLI